MPLRAGGRRHCCVSLIAAVSAATQSICAAPVNDPPYHSWSGGVGYWSDPGMWWPAVIPGQGSSATSGRVFIDRSNPISSKVLLDVNASIGRLRLDGHDTLVIHAGSTLTLNEGMLSFDNAGVVQIAGGGGNEQVTARLALAGSDDFHFRGDGRLVMTGPGAVIEGVHGSPHLTNVNHTIEGWGALGNGMLSMANFGKVVANVPFKSLTVTTSAGGLLNGGAMWAIDGGWLRLIDTDVANHDGLIGADHGSFVELDGSMIDGGVLATNGNGLIRNMIAPAHWQNLVNDGRYMLGPTELQLQGAIRNDGFIDAVGDLTATLPASTIRLVPGESGQVAIEGTGILTLLSCEIVAGGSWEPAQLTHGAEHTIRGEGFIGDGDVSIVNDGVIVADGQNLLRFDPGPGRSLANFGTLRAVGTAGIAIYTGSFFNGGLVDVHDGSRLLMVPGSVAQNNTGGILVGGHWRVEGHQVPAQLILNGSNILVNAADVSLVGPVSKFPKMDSVASNSGAFRLLAGRHFSTHGYFLNWGELLVESDSSLHVNGTFENKAGATLELQLSNCKPQCELVCVGGVAKLGGKLRLIVDAPLPPGTTVDLIAAETVLGQFSIVDAPPGITVSYAATGVSATVTGLAIP